jgi:hypothetical protein
MKKLYIRTQDRSALLECTEIHYNETKHTNRKTKHTIIANFGLAGEYATKERCLEIIDDIENRLVEDVDFVLYTMPEK